MSIPDVHDKMAGVLLGTALGDALGLVTEGMSAGAIERRFGKVDRFHLLGSTGFVSDDTEQSALIAQSLAHHGRDQDAVVKVFRRALLGWFLRLPWGIGLATLRSCMKIALGLRRSGVRSAGNGAAMRAAIVGAFFFDDRDARLRVGRALAEVTHLDARAVEGALYVGEVAAHAFVETDKASPEARARIVRTSRSVITEASLGEAIGQAVALAERGASLREAAAAVRTTGFVVHTVPFATFCFLRFGASPLEAVQQTVAAGGDTDSIGAIVGAWAGALHGASSLPTSLLIRIHDGPFGPSHLRALAANLCARRAGRPTEVARYSALHALLRNLALYPVILFQGLRRLLPLRKAA